ncbi:MAG: hypothetical protein HYT73_04885 [Candidatus Aenigmarchaeota archaeon]|nr:hypothetical protein [Candidatus Aenigmarchaeota archaeon]
MNVLLSLAVVVTIAVASIYVVLTETRAAVDSASLAGEFSDAESFLKSLDNQIMEVQKEGPGSRRLFPFSVSGGYEVSDAEDSVIREMQSSPEFVQYQSSVLSENIVFVSGSQSSCFERDESGDGLNELVMENPYIKAVFRKTARASPLATIRTNETIISMQEKSGGNTVSFVNSSVLIDGNSTSSSGSGYTELLKTGSNKPFCTVRMFVNSTAGVYDVFYTLYSSSDFIVADVRNIR